MCVVYLCLVWFFVVVCLLFVCLSIFMSVHCSMIFFFWSLACYYVAIVVYVGTPYPKFEQIIAYLLIKEHKHSFEVMFVVTQWI